MTEIDASVVPPPQKKVKPGFPWATFNRVMKYTVVKLSLLFMTVVIGIYLTVLIANMGGFVDRIRKAQIREGVALAMRGNREYTLLPEEERAAIMNDLIAQEEERLGLNRPFVIRSFGYLANALTLNLGFAEQMTSDSGSKQVRLIILERLPPTLILFGTTNLFLFFLAISIALYLSRRYGSFLDRFIVAMAPTSAAPGWFYGIFLILIFAALLQWLPFGGMVKAPPPESTWEYALSMMRHMILPITAIIVSAIFSSAFSWRTFFLIYSSEDYVEMAKMKGLTARDIERKYILRPTLPPIITSFAFLIIGLWGGAPIFETVFNWPGLGRATFQAIGFYDTPVIVGITIVFSYLLAITVFLLDFIYALVDPRVKIGAGESKS